jgi:hypothetical protein
MKNEPYYVDVYHTGKHSTFTYAADSSIDRATREGIRGYVVAYRIKVTPKPGAVVTTKYAIPGPTLAELQVRHLINKGRNYSEPILPPVSHQMWKALGALGILFLMMAFFAWFLRDLLQ